MTHHLLHIIFLGLWVFAFQSPDGVKLKVVNESKEECERARGSVLLAIGQAKGWMITRCMDTSQGEA